MMLGTALGKLREGGREGLFDGQATSAPRSRKEEPVVLLLLLLLCQGLQGWRGDCPLGKDFPLFPTCR